MSTQLDPVTGAPILTPDLGNIDQLPYKVQPVPLQDQTNQPQLGRPYLYPDDVPPVLANINAMNGNQQDQAQTLHTDGNHALKVAMSGGSGGGIVGSTYTFGSASAQYVNAHTIEHYAGHIHYNKYMFAVGVIFYLDLSSASFPVNNQLDFGFYDAANRTYNVMSWPVAITSGSSGQDMSGTIYVAFNPPFLPTESGFRNDAFSSVDCFISNETGSGFYYNIFPFTDG